MRQINFYKPAGNFIPGKKTGAAFQFKSATKRTSKGGQEPCVWVEAVQQTKPKPPQRASKQSAFVWDENKIVFCLSIVDLGKLCAFFNTKQSLDSARFVLNAFVANNAKFTFELPANSVELVHQSEDRKIKKQVTKGFKMHYPYGQDKDVELVMTSNKGVGHSVVKMFLKPEECALLYELMRGTVGRYCFDAVEFSDGN